MNLDLKAELKDLDGKSIFYNDSNLSVGRSIAIILTGHQDLNDKMRAYVLSQELYSKDSIELNASDLSFIKDNLSTAKTFTPIILGQLLKILADKKE